MKRETDDEKKYKTFLERVFESMMESLLAAAVNGVLDTLFEELGFTSNNNIDDQWVDEMMQDDEIQTIIHDSANNLYEYWAAEDELEGYDYY